MSQMVNEEAYKFQVQGPGIHSFIEISDESDLEIVETIMAKLRKKVKARPKPEGEAIVPVSIKITDLPEVTSANAEEVVPIKKETPTISASPGAIRPSSTPAADARKKVAIPDNHYPLEWEITLKDKDIIKVYKVITTVNGNHIDVSKDGVNQQTIPLGNRDNAYVKIKQMTYNQAYAGHTVRILRTAHKNALYES
jgi:hypothetical protein